MTTHAVLDPFAAFAKSRRAPPSAVAGARPLCYRSLLGAAWNELPLATRKRFSQHEATYIGSIELRASAAGRWVERLCRLVGSPLPPPHAAPLPATVTVARDPATGGDRWTRYYAFPHQALAITSVKALDDDGALIERLALGLRMRLSVGVRDGALCFDSTGYYIELPAWRWRDRRFAGCRLPLPAWFLPGQTCVAHRDLGGGLFRFTMTVRHRLLGELFTHTGVFRRAGS